MTDDPQGFTIIEVVLAALLLGVAVTALAAGFAQSQRLLNHARRSDVRWFHTRADLAAVMASCTPGSLAVDHGDGFTSDIVVAAGPVAEVTLVARDDLLSLVDTFRVSTRCQRGP